MAKNQTNNKNGSKQNQNNRACSGNKTRSNANNNNVQG